MRRSRASQLYSTQRLSRQRGPGPFRLGLLALAATLIAAASSAAPPQSDALARVRLFYNHHDYAQAISAASKLLTVPAVADSARVVIGRSHLELFRQSANQEDLQAGREALRQVQSAKLPARDRVDFLVGLGESLYLDNSFGPASEIFSTALDASTPADLRDSVFDWWASSIDRLALTLAADDRPDWYAQIVARADGELLGNPASGTAAYWLAAASRGAGDLDRAWNAAIAGWVRALLLPDRGVQLRADLDHLVETGLIPERARTLGPDRDRAAAQLKKEWDGVKESWK